MLALAIIALVIAALIVGFRVASHPQPLTDAEAQVGRNLASLDKALESRKHNSRGEIFFRLPKNPSADLLQDVVYRLCDHCSLSGVSVGVTFEPLRRDSRVLIPGHGNDAAGHVLQFGPSRFSIWISKKFLELPLCIGAILAHEVSHIYSMKNELNFRTGDSSQNFLASEQMTDLLAVSLGMGKLISEGASYSTLVVTRRGGVEQKGTLGYLSPALLRFAYRHWSAMYAFHREGLSA